MSDRRPIRDEPAPIGSEFDPSGLASVVLVDRREDVATICGRLDHVRTGTRQPFRGIDAMGALLLAQLHDEPVAVTGIAPAPGPTRPLVAPVDPADGTHEARPRDEGAIEWTER